MALVPTLIQLPDPAVMPPTGGTGFTRGVSWSPNGVYCVVHIAISPWIIIYKRVGETLTAIATASRPSPTGETRTGGWTSDSQYYVYGQTLPSPYMRCFRNNGDDTFTAVTVPASSVFGGDVDMTTDNGALVIAKNASPWVQFYGFNNGTATAWTIAYTGGGPTDRVYAAAFDSSHQWVGMAGFGGSPFFWLYFVTGVNGTVISLQRVTITNQLGVAASFGPSNRMGWMKGKPVFAVMNADTATIQIIELLTASTAVVRRVFDVSAIVGTNINNASVEFSDDNRKLYFTSNNGGAFVEVNPTTFEVSPVRFANNVTPTTTEKSASRIIAAEGKQYVSFVGDDLPRFRWYKTNDRLINSQIGGLQAKMLGAPTKVDIALSFQSLTGEIKGGQTELVSTDNFAPVTTYVGMEALAPPVSQVFAQIVDNVFSFKSLTSNGYLMLRDQDNVTASFQAMTTAAFVMVPTRSFLDLSFGALTMDGSIDIVPQIFAEFAFGSLTMDAFMDVVPEANLAAAFQSLTTDILISKPHYPSYGDFSFQSLTTAGELKMTDHESTQATFQSLTMDAYVNVPVYYYGEFAFQPLTTAGFVKVPVDAHLGLSFQPLTTAAVVNVPRPAYIAGTFGRLESEIIGNVPEAIWVTGTFQSLTAELVGNVPQAIWITGGFQSLKMDSVVMVPKAVWIEDFNFQSLTMESVVNVPRAIWIDGGFQSLTMEANVGSTIGLDTRLVFGKLTTKGVIGYPIKINGDLILPFVSVIGQLDMTIFLAGDLTLPGFMISGELEFVNAVNAAIELPWLDVDGALSWAYELNGDVVLPAVELAADLYMDMDLYGDIVLPFVDVRGSGASDTSGTGSAPALIGDANGVRVGGGVFFGFDAITIG